MFARSFARRDASGVFAFAFASITIVWSPWSTVGEMLRILVSPFATFASSCCLRSVFAAFFDPPWEQLATGLNEADQAAWDAGGYRMLDDATVRTMLRAIAFHDAGGDRSQTVAAIAPIIVALRAEHLEPVTIDRLYGGATT